MRILLVEDHPIVRAGCLRLLHGNGHLDVREAATAAEGLRVAHEFSPDIIILDLKLPDGSGLGLLGPLTSPAPDRKVIVFSMYEDPAFAAQALEAGAKGYVSKNDDPEVILQAVERVSAGGIFLTASMAERLALTRANLGNPAHRLSSREMGVLELLGQGRTLSEIADQLQISYRTSASIAAQIKAKLNITSNAALIRWAVGRQQV
ncbi:MAG: response regulator transcription factor [Acetobacteraceae bacterium]|nr:response regulator transcription factor [Acetobacteraceae bacterium]MBV8615317.1 response regulator transcription factor [Acetobacteraceae bacterium]